MHPIALHDLHLRYGARSVLRGLNLHALAGTVYGFLGRNGAGKSTTFRALLGIERPSRGEVEINGERFRRVPPRARRGIGYLSQEQRFYDWMGATELGRFVGAFYPTWDAARFTTLLDRLAVPRTERSGTLSVGTRRKLGLALALAPRPPVILLDEPTSGVDPVTRAEILELVREVARQDGSAVLFSTHYIAEIEAVATHLGLLHDGRLFYEGPLDGLPREVRRTSRAAPGLTVLRAEADGVVAHGPAAAWEGVPSEPMSLDAIFVAVAANRAEG